MTHTHKASPIHSHWYTNIALRTPMSSVSPTVNAAQTDNAIFRAHPSKDQLLSSTKSRSLVVFPTHHPNVHIQLTARSHSITHSTTHSIKLFFLFTTHCDIHLTTGSQSITHSVTWHVQLNVFSLFLFPPTIPMRHIQPQSITHSIEHHVYR